MQIPRTDHNQRLASIRASITKSCSVALGVSPQLSHYFTFSLPSAEDNELMTVSKLR